jgi:hypothetical protein
MLNQFKIYYKGTEGMQEHISTYTYHDDCCTRRQGNMKLVEYVKEMWRVAYKNSCSAPVH